MRFFIVPVRTSFCFCVVVSSGLAREVSCGLWGLLVVEVGVTTCQQIPLGVFLVELLEAIFRSKKKVSGTCESSLSEGSRAA